MRKSQLAFFVCFGTAVIGCTTILGDFDVSNTPAGPGADGGPGPGGECQAGQTLCDNTCVDTKTSAAHCGVCNHACPAGLTCSEGNCACPDKGAFCGGQCYPATDRQHCGTTCSVCTGNQVCQGNCVDPPAAAFDKPPRSATGWKDAANNPLTIVVKATGQPGTIYECRTGPAAKFGTPAEPAWANCDGANGDGTSHQPKEDANAKEGTYRTEHRYKLGDYLSPVASVTYYVHKSLDGVASCPRQGVPLDGPHFTDQQYFEAATAWAIANPGVFPIGGKFPDGGQKPSDAIYLGNPWIKIPFSGIYRTKAMGASYEPDDPWPASGGDYLFNERTLRHRFSINPVRNLIAVTRQYIHPNTNDCKQQVTIGGLIEPQYGPPGRGIRKLECEAYVLNTKGNALCLIAKDGKVEIKPIDRRIPLADALDGGKSLGNTFTTYANQTYVYSTVANGWTGVTTGGFVQIPEGDYSRWYEVASVSGQYLYLTEPYQGTAGANTKVRYTATAQQIPVVASGFTKLHQGGHHAWATGKQKVGGVQISHPMPSHRNKCDVPGCNAGKPWLTFLPP